MDKDARKRDTREKITLGGLVVKARLRTLDRTVLLGALLDLAKLSPRSPAYAQFQAAGRAAFAAGPDPGNPETENPEPGNPEPGNGVLADAG